MKPGLESRITALPDLEMPALIEQYRHLHGKAPSRRLPRAHIELAVAYQLQKQLTAKLQAKMMQVLTATEAITTILITNSQHTELVREWRGHIYSVTLLDDGVIYNDQRYATLSAVAHVITGKHISGTEFFGAAPKQDKRTIDHA